MYWFMAEMLLDRSDSKLDHTDTLASAGITISPGTA